MRNWVKQRRWKLHGKGAARLYQGKKGWKTSFATYLGLATDVVDRFVIGLVELGEWHNQMHRAEYYKPKTRIQSSNKTQQRWTRTQQSNWKTKIATLRATEQQKVYNFLAFPEELGTKAKTNYKAHDNTSQATWNLIPLDERLVPDLPRGWDRLIGGDLDIGEEGSE
jgi:hypothetical protein